MMMKNKLLSPRFLVTMHTHSSPTPPSWFLCALWIYKGNPQVIQGKLIHPHPVPYINGGGTSWNNSSSMSKEYIIITSLWLIQLIIPFHSQGRLIHHLYLSILPGISPSLLHVQFMPPILPLHATIAYLSPRLQRNINNFNWLLLWQNPKKNSKKPAETE